MANTIKRDKKVFDYLNDNLKRLNYLDSIEVFFDDYIITNINSSILLQEKEKLLKITSNILQNDSILIEVVKIIGIMEVSDNLEEFNKLNIKRKNRKNSKKELTEFDKILKGILKVPNKEKKEKH